MSAPEPRSTPGPSTGTPEPSQAASEAQVERACEVMHDAYEAAAAGNGWETQAASRKPWADVPEANKATMRAAVGALLDHLAASEAYSVEVARLREAATAVIDLCSHDEACPAWDGDNPCDPTVCAFGRLLTVLASVDAPAPDEADDDTLRESIDDAVWDVLSGFHEVMDVEARADEVADAVLAVLRNRGLIQ